MLIEFETLEDILSFCGVVYDSLTTERVAKYDFLTDQQKLDIKYAMKGFVNIFVIEHEHD